MESDRTLQERWLDAVWAVLPGEKGVLVSPARIRREGLDRAAVRRMEETALVRAWRELEAWRSASGLAAGAVTAPRRGTAGEAALRDRERALHLRRLVLQAEAEILAQEPPWLVARTPDPRWIRHWHELAPGIDSPARCRLFVRALAAEVARPGQLQPAVLDLLAHLGENDARCVELLGRWSFGAFLFDARDRYFLRELHEPWFRIAVGLGLLQSGAGYLTLRAGSEPLLLVCGRRALQITGLGEEGIRLPVLRVTALGRQVLGLSGGASDLAYLLDVAAFLTGAGARVLLGDWHARSGRFRRHFDCA